MRAEVHVSEEELADQVGGDCGLLGFGVVFEDVLDAPVEEADAERAEVVVGGKEGRRLRGVCCGSGIWLCKGSCVVSI